MPIPKLMPIPKFENGNATIAHTAGDALFFFSDESAGDAISMLFWDGFSGSIIITH